MPYLVGHTVKYLSKAGITLLLKVFLGEGRVLKCFSTSDLGAELAFTAWHWGQQQLSLGTRSLALGQGASSAKPGLAGGSQPSLGEVGQGGGPGKEEAWS